MKKFLLSLFCLLTTAIVASAADTYTLLTSIDDLTDGVSAIIVDADGNTAIGTTQNTSNRAAVAVTKDADSNYQIDPNGTVAILEINNVETENGTAAYTLKCTNGTTQGYLYAASSSSNHLKTATTLN